MEHLELLRGSLLPLLLCTLGMAWFLWSMQKGNTSKTITVQWRQSNMTLKCKCAEVDLPACPTSSLLSLQLDFAPETNKSLLCLLLTAKINFNLLKPAFSQISYTKPTNTFTPSWLQMLSARSREYAECLSALDGSGNREHARCWQKNNID